MMQGQALDILKMGYNVFLTGAAGSGKTHVLNQYITFLRKKGVRVGITASTGIAATHINGRTIHSWCGIGIQDQMYVNDFTRIFKNFKLKNRLLQSKVLIIDEISMLDDKRLDLVDQVVRKVRNSQLPFGGMQVVFCGDFFQLPPVSEKGKEPSFAVNAKVWDGLSLKTCYLEEQYRQSDDGFLRLLNNIRNNCVEDIDYEILQEKLSSGDSQFNSDVSTKLYTHNVDVDKLNNFELKKLSGLVKKFVMQSKGRKALIDSLKKSCLAPEELELKKGALVIFIKNNFEKGYVNGTMGKVVDFEEGCPVVETHTGDKILVTPESWIVEENENIEAMIRQFPLRLAWAITVHKSQGMSLDAVEINLAKSFEYGMGYTALSRAKTLGGLKILGLNQTALLVSPKILDLDQEMKQESKNAVRWLSKIEEEEKKKLQEDFINSVADPLVEFKDDIEVFLQRKSKGVKKPNHIKTKEMIMDGIALEKISETLGFKIETIIGHIEKLKEIGEDVDIEYLKPKDFNKIKQAFVKSDDLYLRPIYEALGEKCSYTDIRIARLFLTF